MRTRTAALATGFALLAAGATVLAPPAGAAKPDRTGVPSVVVSPSKGVVGTSVSVTSATACPLVVAGIPVTHASVSMLPAKSTGGPELGPWTSPIDGTGRWTVTFQVPVDAVAGRYQVAASCTDASGVALGTWQYRSANFTVLSPPPTAKGPR